MDDSRDLPTIKSRVVYDIGPRVTIDLFTGKTTHTSAREAAVELGLDPDADNVNLDERGRGE